MSIFTKTDEYTQRPPRNTFDGSFANNLTLKAGQITPCFLKEVVPGDSFRIDAKLGFNFQPMIFPVQTDMQCNLHFFYVRNRALWKGWENFITKTENLEGDSTPPYIKLTEENRHMFDTGEIGDYLGVPTIFYGSDNESYPTYLSNLANNSISSPKGYVLSVSSDDVLSSPFTSLFAGSNFTDVNNVAETIDNALYYGLKDNENYLSVKNFISQNNNSVVPTGTFAMRLAVAPLPPKLLRVPKPTFSQLSSLLTTAETTIGIGTNPRVISGVYDVTDQKVVAFSVMQSVDGVVSEFLNTKVQVLSGNPYFVIPSTGTSVHEYFMFAFSNAGYESSFRVGSGNIYFVSRFDAHYGIPNEARRLSDLPFVSSDIDTSGKTGEIRVSAMPFRAVEACYNSFYRDDRNNPLIIDNKPYYNVWVQNRNGGADTGIYKLYRKNWQQDVFTTAVQSPQQGVMPLVGVTASGQMTFSDENGKTYYLQAEFGDDGHTITGISSYSSDMPAGTLRAMVDTISTGISINDFRNVNALQRWLETNMRKGLRYKDQIEAHFGTSPTYSELQMPEFIGGMSRRVSMSAIEQTVDTLNPSTGTGNALGTLGGRASVVGNDGSPVTHYCDEHGWIIGFVTITPSPVYSQQLNKQLTKQNLLDYYFPEFAHIGYQPILNEEIAPLQCKSGQQSNGNGLKDVFGYNRAWYEYLEYVDEVHGDFRTSMRHYLIQRIFNGVPKLGEEFLTVSDREVNQVFAVEDDSDKIFGQIFFDVKMKRPFPRLGIPKLETE